MSQQTTPITDHPSTDRPTTENGTYPSMARSAKLHPARRRIATFDDYAEAERAVERLTAHGFPVERVAIVGRDLRSVEQITGRLTFASAAGGERCPAPWSAGSSACWPGSTR